MKLTSLLQNIRLASNLLGQLLAALEPPHQTPSDIVLAVPLDLLGRSRVEDQSDRELVVLPHLTRDIVAVLQLVDESVTRIVDEESADTTQSFGREEFDLNRSQFNQ